MVLPFKQKDVYLGLAEIHGLLRGHDDSLEFEYKVKDTTLGFMDSSLKSCHIPLRIIDLIEVEKKWFSGIFEISFNRLPDLDNPFQLEENRLTLSVKKNDLEKARSFRSELMNKIMERKIDELSEESIATLRSKTKQERPAPRPGKSRDSSSDGLKNILREE